MELPLQFKAVHFPLGVWFYMASNVPNFPVYLHALRDSMENLLKPFHIVTQEIF